MDWISTFVEILTTGIVGETTLAFLWIQLMIVFGFSINLQMRGVPVEPVKMADGEQHGPEFSVRWYRYVL